MLTTKVKAQLALFLVAALAGVAYMAVRYIGVLQMIGQTGYHVQLELPSTGGIFTNGEVDYRGVQVGRVGDMKLTDNGIEVTLNMTSSLKIPSDVKVVVANRTAMGEQYVNLEPRTSAGPYLSDGSRITQDNTELPPALSTLLNASNDFLSSVPIPALQKTVDELYLANDGLSGSLKTLMSNTSSFFSAAAQNLPSQIALIETSQTVLATQVQEADAITAFSKNLSLISQQLVASDGDIRKVISAAPTAAVQVSGLITDLNSSLSLLVTNLLTTSNVFLAQPNNLKAMLAKLPVAVTIGGSVITTSGLNAGLIPTFFDPLPCVSGYDTTKVFPGQTTTTAPFNTAAKCTASPSTGIDVRGSQNAPSGS